MIVKVKLFAMLRSHLPPGSDGESVELDVKEGATALNIVETLEIPPQMAHLVMLDGYHLLPEEIQYRPIKPGEVLSIFPPVAGG